MYFRYSVFFPEHNKIPGVSKKEAATNAAIYLIEAIVNPAPACPFASIWDITLKVIRYLADIFKQKTYEQDDWVLFPTVGNNILNKTRH